MIGNIPPFYSSFPYGPVPSSGTASTKFVDLFNAQSAAGAKTWTGLQTISQVMADPGTPVWLNLTATDDAVGAVSWTSSSASTFRPMLVCSAPGSGGPGLESRFRVATDSGTVPAHVIDLRTTADAALTTRPYLGLRNAGADILSFIPLNSGANTAMSWGTQSGAAPTITTSRSVGTRLILRDSFSSGVTTDYAIGMSGTAGSGNQWASVPAATSSFEHQWFAGATNIASLRGDGLQTTTGGRVKKYRIALTSPVTIAVTDDIVEVNLTTPGAVTINYPATPETGREYITIDGKGDAGANNHTHTPAAGNVNGAASVVAATNYYRGKASYNGTQWLFAKEIP